MCIAASVGRGGSNGRDDVRTVQVLLSLVNVPGLVVPGADGRCGPATIAAIEAFQKTLPAGGDAVGLVTPDAPGGRGGATVRAFRRALAAGFTQGKLQGIFIHASDELVQLFFAPLASAMGAASIDTPLRQSHFLAQVGHECGELRYTEEIASGAAYEGRADLGNTQPGDGVRFKGRGLIQLTGRANYAAFGKAIGQDLTHGEAPKRIASEPDLAVRAATWFWQTHGLNTPADADDVVAITRRINGGTNGLDDRKRLLTRAKWFLLPAPVVSIVAAAPEDGSAATRRERSAWLRRRRRSRRPLW